MEDELTLRDLYLILKRGQRVILGLTFGLALLVFTASLVLPKTYTSTATLSLATTNFLTATGLAQGFIDRLETPGAVLDDRDAAASARFDEKKGILVLKATGTTPAEAENRAQRLVEAFQAFALEQSRNALTQKTQADLVQARLDLERTQDSLARIERALAALPALPAGTDPERAAALEAVGVDPLVARANDPAATFLRLERSKQQVRVAALEAQVRSLGQLLNDAEAVDTLAQRNVRVQVLNPPGRPEEPTAPRPLLYTALAGVLGLMLGVFWVFVREALREPETPALHDPQDALV